MKELINQELAVTLPDGFRRMTPEEMKQAYAREFENMLGFRDEERHIIFVVTWNESNKLAVKLTNPKALAKRAEKHMARSYKGHDYQDGSLFETKLAGREAWGVRYGYTVQGVKHSGETVVFLRDICCYTLYYYTHLDLVAENRTVHDELFASLRFE